MDINELRARRDKLNHETQTHLQKMDDLINEGKRVTEISENPKQLLMDIDQEFENLTKISSSDIPFFVFATILQSVRWFLMPELKIPQMENLSPEIDKSDRLKSNVANQKSGPYAGKSSGASYEQERLAEYRDAHSEKTKTSKDEFYKKENQYRSWIEILAQPVPYDAMNSLDIEKECIPNIANLNKQNKNGTFNNIYGGNHHVATLGHDPILGWIFGTANIMTSTISFVDFQHYQVVRGHRIKSLNQFEKSCELLFSDQAVDYASPRFFIDIMNECYYSSKEDYRRIVASVVRQAIHMESDKYCIEGLPIPFLSVIDPQRAQTLIEEGWNSIEFTNLLKGDLKKIGLSAGFDILIRIVLEVIYVMCLESDDEINIRKVKAKRILSASGVIASSANVVHSLIMEKHEKIDFGGIGIELLHLLRLPDFETKIKQEYIKIRFRETVMNNESEE